MRIHSWIAALAATAALGGCYTYPVYQPMPVARLTPQQSAALAGQPISQADRDRYARDNAQVAQSDSFTQSQPVVVQPYAYGYPVAPYYDYPYYGYGYPYYSGFYPFFPSVSLGFGFRGGFHGGGYHGGGYRGGYHGHR